MIHNDPLFTVQVHSLLDGQTSEDLFVDMDHLVLAEDLCRCQNSALN